MIQTEKIKFKIYTKDIKSASLEIPKISAEIH